MNKNIIGTAEVTSRLYDFILQEVEKKKIFLIEHANILDVLPHDKEPILAVVDYSNKYYAYGFKQYISARNELMKIIRYFSTPANIQKVNYYISIEAQYHSDLNIIYLVPLWESVGSVSCGPYDVPQPGKKIELGKYNLKGEIVFDHQYGEDIWVWDLA